MSTTEITNVYDGLYEANIMINTMARNMFKQNTLHRYAITASETDSTTNNNMNAFADFQIPRIAKKNIPVLVIHSGSKIYFPFKSTKLICYSFKKVHSYSRKNELVPIQF